MSKIVYNDALKPFAQKLRREMTRQERHLWYDFLKSYPIQFRRQKQFGSYIVDFYCADARLVVELDGSQHYDEDNRARDEERDNYLSGWGISVRRFGNYDVDRHFDSVCATIDTAVRERLWGEE
ncbi:MAG: endonuclease domain-containing protein [Clostridia bacterium]|nr:endonuclease domain-containing protein [Clostridia bacterium]